MTSRIKSQPNKLLVTKGQFETEAWAVGNVICGIDEVGRGCLAGPLVTAAVILPCNTTSSLLKDSKILSEAMRLEAYAWIIKHAWCATGIVHHRIVDDVNVWHATLSAMKKALMHVMAHCPYKPSAIVIDAMPLKLDDTSFAHIPVHRFYKGETLSPSIAAASIVAKVRRDALMRRFNTLFPGYYFANHKGYGTEKHTIVLLEKPKSLIHRITFAIPTTYCLSKKETSYEEKRTICGGN